MKHLKLFFACLLMAVLSIGQMWATDPTISWAFKTLATTSGTQDGITWETGKTGSASATACNSTNGLVLYGVTSGGGYFQTTSAISGTITNVNIVSSNKKNIPKYTVYCSADGSNWTAIASDQTAGTKDHAVTGSYTYVKVANTTGATAQLAVTSITVTYTAGGGGGSTPSLSADPDALDFDVVGKDDVVAAKTFTLTGSNLTDANAVTLTAPTGYTVSPNSVTPSDGAISETITVTPITGTVGTFNGNLTISSDDLSDDVEVALSMEVKAKYTVTWNNNGATSTTQVLDGEKPVFPATPAACDATSTTFIGWAVDSWSGKVTTPAVTIYTKASDMPAVDDAVTYYAVFAKSNGSSAFDGEHGGTFKIYAQVEEDKVYAGSYSSSKYGGTTEAADATDFVIAAVDDAFTIKDGNKYLTYSGSSTNFGKSDDPYYWNIEAASTAGSWHITSVNTSGRGFIYRASTYNVFGAYGSGNVNGTEYFDVEIAGAASYEDYMTTCCTKYAVNIAAGITNGSVSADPTSACEGATVTLTFSPALNYHLSAWTLNGTDQDIAENTFTMPGEAVTISATFAEDACTPLGTPSVSASGKAYPYDAVKLSWTVISNADKYKVYIYDNDDNELEHNDAFAGVEYTIGQTLEAGTTYKYSVQALSNAPASFCPSTAAEGTFATDALPTAKLYLVQLKDETPVEEGTHTVSVEFDLPTSAASCGKTLVGWTTATYKDYEHATDAPAVLLKKYTFTSTDDVTLYAVYADVTGGGTSTTDIKCTVSTTTNMTGGNDADLLVDETDAADAGWVVTGYKGGGSNYPGLNKDGTIRLYYNASGNSYIDVTAPSTITSVAVTCKSGNDNIIVKVGENAIALDDDVYPINATSFRIINGYTSSTQVHITNIAVNFTTPGSPSNYSTTCAAAPTATPASNSIEVDAAGASSTLGVTYENVNLAGVGVALYNNAACTEDFDGGWLTASIAGDDKHIAYTITENSSYNDARTAYIKLTAPETSSATAPATAIITVTQAKKAAAFANLADLVAANINNGTQVTVTFEEVITNDQTISGPKRAGLFLTTTAGSSNKAIEIFYNKGTTAVPAGWQIGGKLAATSMTFTWTLFNSDQWELVPLGNDWTWDNGDLTYTAPKTVSSVVVSGAPTKTTYVDGEKFAPAGLTVTVNYNDATSETNPAGVTFACTPERVAKSDDPVSVSVVATFNEVDSDPFEVTGLTVGDIQLKTTQEFITAGNADMRCYLEGIVSDIETASGKLKYGNFNLTDASGTIYVYGCLNQAGEAQKFDELGVANGDKIKVIAEDYEYYNSKHEAKNVVFVSKISPVEITIADKTLEEGEEWTIEATTDPAGAVANISYSIKEGSDDCITLDNVNKKITANSVGTATIIASIPAGEGYLANSIEFEVEVVEAGSVANVVILVEYEGAWYAMKHDKSGVLVDYQPAIGKIYGMTDPDEQAEIVWTRSKTGTTYTFTTGNKYIKGANSGTSLSVETGETGKYQWEKGAEETYYHCTTGRTFFYNGTDFKNYAIGNAGTSGYSSLPKVELSDDIFTSNTIYTRNVSGNYGTICLPKAGVLTNGALYEISYYDADQKKIFFDEVEGGVMVAGAPYIFKPNENVTELKVAYTDATVVENAGHKNGLYGHYDIDHPTEGDEDARLYLAINDYFLRNNEYWKVDQENRVYVDNYRAYIKLDKIGNDVLPQAYGRRRVAMNVNGEQVATGFENLNASEKPVKLMIDGNIYILRGEKLYDATGRLVK